MKKKVNLLPAALNGWGGHSSCWNRGWGIGKGGPLGNSPQTWPKGSEPLKKNQCAFCCQEGHWKSECSQLQPRHRETKATRQLWGLQGSRPTTHFSSPENVLWEGISWPMSFSICQNIQWHWWPETR
jgi:hypothetical protein